MKINIRDKWLGENKTLIAGPCSAESEQQMLKTAQGIYNINKDAIFRAGIWKPRTRPGTFEGFGNDALNWLSLIKKEIGLQTATEVAIPRHVEAALKSGVDILWIGTRTTVNPFLIQELASSLEGVDIPVMVKNPIHPELSLWLGSIERFSKAGINRIAAIHRGFYTYEHLEYRNTPRWELVYELKTSFPNLPVICDISHIAGATGLLPMVAQQAIDLGLEGLMIETHNDPHNALSDANQQITPHQLANLLSGITVSNKSFPDEILNSQMGEIRNKIDKLDSLLLQTLSDRMELAREIGELKKIYSVSILQIERWKEVIENCMTKADQAGLYREFVRNILIQIHDESIRIQSEILTSGSKALLDQD